MKDIKEMLRWSARASSLCSSVEASDTVGKPRTGDRIFSVAGQ